VVSWRGLRQQLLPRVIGAVAELSAALVSAFWCYVSYFIDSFHAMPEQRPLTVPRHLLDAGLMTLDFGSA